MSVIRESGTGLINKGRYFVLAMVQNGDLVHTLNDEDALQYIGDPAVVNYLKGDILATFCPKVLCCALLQEYLEVVVIDFDVFIVA